MMVGLASMEVLDAIRSPNDLSDLWKARTLRLSGVRMREYANSSFFFLSSRSQIRWFRSGVTFLRGAVGSLWNCRSSHLNNYLVLQYADDFYIVVFFCFCVRTRRILMKHVGCATVAVFSRRIVCLDFEKLADMRMLLLR